MNRHREPTNTPMRVREGGRDARAATAALPAARTAAGTCIDCGWPHTDAEVVSRHRTSQGLVVWSRCVCGALQIWLYRPGAATSVARAGQQDGGWGGARP